MSRKPGHKLSRDNQLSARWYMTGLFAVICAISIPATANLFDTSNEGFIPDGIDVASAFAESNSKRDSDTFGVIGEDSRRHVQNSTQYPFTAIGQLLIDDEKTCSGTLISAQHVLTAAHCIYNKFDNSFAKKVYFAPGRNGAEVPYGWYKVTDYYLPEEYLKLNANRGGADIAVLKLALEAGNTVGWLGTKPFSDPPASVLQELEQQIVGVMNGGNSSAGRIEEVIDDFVFVHPDYSLNYFGFSGDKGGEMWGDECFGHQVDPLSTDKFLQVRVFCDDQPGASGSGYFDDSFYVSAVASWHKGASRTNYAKDDKGRLTGNIEGSWQEVYNMNQAISDYTFGLINSWIADGTGTNTIHKNIASAASANHLAKLN